MTPGFLLANAALLIARRERCQDSSCMSLVSAPGRWRLRTEGIRIAES
jgi:hypothetical protein